MTVIVVTMIVVTMIVVTIKVVTMIVATLMVKKPYKSSDMWSRIPSSSIWILASLSLGQPSSCPRLRLRLLLGLGEVIVQPLLSGRA